MRHCHLPSSAAAAVLLAQLLYTLCGISSSFYLCIISIFTFMICWNTASFWFRVSSLISLVTHAVIFFDCGWLKKRCSNGIHRTMKKPVPSTKRTSRAALTVVALLLLISVYSTHYSGLKYNVRLMFTSESELSLYFRPEWCMFSVITTGRCWLQGMTAYPLGCVLTSSKPLGTLGME